MRTAPTSDGDKPGKFELADKGTILLGEIAEMSPQLQAKLNATYGRGGGSHS